MKKPKQITITVGNLDEKHVGAEPKWDKKLKLGQVARAYNWYNYMLNDDLKLKIVLTQFTNKNDIAALKAVNYIPTSLAAFIRMRENGYDASEAELDKHEDRLKALVKAGKEILKQKQQQQVGPTVSIQARVESSAGRYIADLEDELDTFFNNKFKTEFKPYDWLSKKQLKPMVAQRVAEYYKPLLEEIELALSGKDKDIREGYATHTKAGMLRYKAFVNDIIEDCERWAVNAKKQVVRKPRKKKAISADKMVNKVKYQRADNDLKLTSIDPAKLVGASEAWLYNSKTRMLQHYVAIDRGGFTVKGTTLQNFDEKASFMKKMRKPETVSDYVDNGPKAVIKQFNALKVKPVPCNGRVNEFTLILRVVK